MSGNSFQSSDEQCYVDWRCCNVFHGHWDVNYSVTSLYTFVAEMSKTTQTKILLLLFTYSIVLLHAIIPHCHSGDAHAEHQPNNKQTHKCDGHHHDEKEQSHEHQVCQNDDLHGNYLKSSSNYSASFEFAQAEIVQLFYFVAFDLKEQTSTSKPTSTAVVRSCCIDSNILRGPPAC